MMVQLSNDRSTVGLFTDDFSLQVLAVAYNCAVVAGINDEMYASCILQSSCVAEPVAHTI